MSTSCVCGIASYVYKASPLWCLKLSYLTRILPVFGHGADMQIGSKPRKCWCSQVHRCTQFGFTDHRLSNLCASDHRCIHFLCIEFLFLARLGWCSITPTSCELLGSVLTQSSSLIIKLDLSGNKFEDHGVEMLSNGLANPKCKLENLKYTEFVFK